MELENLIRESMKDPKAITAVEQEVNRLVSSPDISSLYSLQNSSNPATIIYLCKIIELRFKRKILNPSTMTEEINFTTHLLQQNQSYHTCNIYSIAGLYCWPTQFSSFLNDIFALLSIKTGYEILLLFLQKVNNSTEIDEKRRSELKTAIRMVSNDLFSAFKEEFAFYIIQIYTELLKMIPMNYDYSLVFRKAGEYPNEAVEFFVESGSIIDQNKVVEVLSQLPENSSMIILFTNSKMKNFTAPERVFEYIFRCLTNDPDCFIPAVDFWQKLFSSKDKAMYLEPVLTEVIKIYLKMDDEEKEETDGYVYGFFTVAAKNYAEKSMEFLIKNESDLPGKLIGNFLQKIYKGPINFPNKTFRSSYLNCLVAYLEDSQNSVILIDQLDFKDKESVKLIIKIMGKYEISREQLMNIFNKCDNGCLNANEIKVESLLKLGVPDTFDGEWTMDKVVRFYYFLKKDQKNYLKYKDSFLALFIQNAPFDRCFSIVEKLGDVPTFILQNIYDKMDKYSYVDLSCFNSDLLAYLSLDIQRPFIEKEVARFISEWYTITDYKNYYQCIKTLLTVFNSRLTEPGMVDLMLDLIQIDYVVIINRILAMFISYNGSYNTKKAIYYFITSYNAPNLNASQAQLVAALTSCMYQPDGPQSFNEVLELDLNKCNEIRSQISKTNRKTAQNIIRNFIKDFRGKPLRNLYENEIKVTKQNFLKSKPVVEEDDTEINL